MVVSYGMIGASLSGATFLSVPGNVYKDSCHYITIALSFFFGYMIVAFVLLPLFYRLNLTSIYTYLEQRFGPCSYRTGAVFFIMSRLLGAAIRTYVVIMVLHVFVLTQLNIPFWLIAAIFILLAILYTYRGGVKTIVWTDTFQTTFVILAVIMTMLSLTSKLNLSGGELYREIGNSRYFEMFDWNWKSHSFVLKHVILGVLIPVVMTGLDQGMMQKIMSCRNLRDAQKSMVTATFMIITFIVVSLFLGVMLSLFCDQNKITIGSSTENMIHDTDHIFPTIAFEYLGPLTGLCFFIGLISAAYPTCANALTSMTTSTCIDLLGLEKRKDLTDDRKKRMRQMIQVILSFLLFITVLVIHTCKRDSIINVLYWVTSYTYGPLLALYTFGFFSRRRVYDKSVLWICLVAPIICGIVEYSNVVGRTFGFFSKEPVVFSFGFSLLLLNAGITYIGLVLCSTKPSQTVPLKDFPGSDEQQVKPVQLEKETG